MLKSRKRLLLQKSQKISVLRLKIPWDTETYLTAFKLTIYREHHCVVIFSVIYCSLVIDFIMAKPIINPQKWTTDDFRLMVVLLLTVIYPLFVSSFFALYVFTLLPIWVTADYTLEQAHQEGWYHYYWVFAALLWVFLCALILPCFWDQHEKTQQAIDLTESGAPGYPTKPETVQPFLHVEESVDNKRVSVLSLKSRNSSLSIEKDICEEKEEKNSLEKSRESLQKSCTSLERKKLTQSGEFLNEFIISIESEELKQKEAECEVHAEEKEDTEKKDTFDNADTGERLKDMEEKIDKDKKDEDKTDKDEKDEEKTDIKDKKGEEKTDKNKKDEEKTDKEKKDEDNAQEEKKKPNQETLDTQSTSSDSSESEANEPVIAPEKKEKLLETHQEKIEEAEMLGESTEELEEANSTDPQIRKKARPTVDTSRASGCYECSMPTPKSADATRPESNMVFLFVNPDIADAQEDIIVEHEGEVQDACTQKEK